MNNIMTYIGYAFVSIGIIFYFLGGLGLLRMPDFYNRAQASTKATTLGSFSILLGVGLIDVSYLPKAILVIILIGITNPVGASVLSRAAYLCGVERTDKTKLDEIQDMKGGMTDELN